MVQQDKREDRREVGTTLDSATRIKLTVGQIGVIVTFLVGAIGAMTAFQYQVTGFGIRLDGSKDNPGIADRVRAVETQQHDFAEFRKDARREIDALKSELLTCRQSNTAQPSDAQRKAEFDKLLRDLAVELNSRRTPRRSP